MSLVKLAFIEFDLLTSQFYASQVSHMEHVISKQKAWFLPLVLKLTHQKQTTLQNGFEGFF